MSGESIKESLNAAMAGYDDSGGASASSLEPYHEPERDIFDEGEGQDDPPAKSAPGRDSRGRFLKSGQEAQDEIDEDTTTLTQEFEDQEASEAGVEHEAPEKPIPPPPSGFSKHADLWNKLNDPNAPIGPEDKRAFLDFYRTREDEMLRGISQYKDVAAKSHYLSKAIEQYIPYLQQENIDPGTFIGNLANFHFLLKSGTPEKKVEIFNYLMQSYGVQMNQQGQISEMDPHTQAVMEQLKGVQSKLTMFEQERLQKEEFAIQSEIEALQKNVTDFPFFEEARGTMIRLLEQGHAKTFEEAYRLAIRLDDKLWEKSQSGRLQQAAPKQHIQQAKKAAVSVSNQAPAAKPVSRNAPSKSPQAIRSKTSRQSIVDSLHAAMGRV